MKMNLACMIVVACSVFAPARSICLLWAGTCPNICPSAIPTCTDTTDYMKFFLFTRTNPTSSQSINIAASNLAATNFTASKATKIVIHGLSDKSTEARFVAMKDAFLAKSDVNVIMVDYEYYAQSPSLLCLATAQINAQHVGVCTKGLVKALTLAGNVDIHVVGFGLGAQVAAFAGKLLQPTYVLPRITGLDPTPIAPTITYGSLDASDAVFVDVIHTAANHVINIGDADFYVNGGLSQLGCPILSLTDNLYWCSKTRSMDLFTESISTTVGFYGWAWLWWPIRLPGERSILMGNSALLNTTGAVYVPTKATSPYALGV